MATAVITSIQNILKEEIGPSVFEMLPSEIDPAFDGMQLDSSGVERFAELSRGWLIRMTASSGLAGAMKWVDPTADQVNTNSSRYHTNATRTPSNRFPSASNIPLKNVIQFSVPMAKAMGNMSWPLEFKRAEQMTAAIAKYTELNIKGGARMVALNQANSFFAPTTGVIAQVNGTPSSTGDSDGVITCDVDAGRIFQFMDGMLVDIYSNSSGTWTQKNLSGGSATRVVVDAVDYLAKNDGTDKDALRLVADATLDSAIADDDYIVLKDTFVDPASGNDYSRTGPLGLLDMMKDADRSTARYVMSPNNDSTYGIDLRKYPNFGSLVRSSVGVLDESTLNKYFGQYFDATGKDLDTVITTRGVINKYSEFPTLDTGRMFWERTNKGLQFTGGRGEVKQTYEGRNWPLKRSRFCPPGYLFAFQKKGNYKIKVPPRQPDTNSKESRYGAPIEFVGAALGFADDFIPVKAGGAYTEQVQSPFVLFYQIVAEEPVGIVLTGITED